MAAHGSLTLAYWFALAHPWASARWAGGTPVGPPPPAWLMSRFRRAGGHPALGCDTGTLARFGPSVGSARWAGGTLCGAACGEGAGTPSRFVSQPPGILQT